MTDWVLSAIDNLERWQRNVEEFEARFCPVTRVGADENKARSAPANEVGMINLCHFDVVVSGTRYPAAVDAPLVLVTDWLRPGQRTRCFQVR